MVSRAADGSVLKFNDLPREYQANLDAEVPFDRHEGDKPSLSEAEVQDIVAFLNTLTDGYVSRSH